MGPRDEPEQLTRSDIGTSIQTATYASIAERRLRVMRYVGSSAVRDLAQTAAGGEVE